MSAFQVFYRNVFRHLQTTGSVAPSSRFLARAMLYNLQGISHPASILEVGPGTGPFTKPLAEWLQDGDRLDLCELNDEFVRHLRNLMETHPAMSARQAQINLFHMPVQDLKGEKCYDAILSGLPFNNFEPDLVQSILDMYVKLIKPGGRLSFFEYAWVRNMKKMVATREDNIRVEAVGNVLKRFLNQYQKEQLFVPLNFPPSIVHVCRFD